MFVEEGKRQERSTKAKGFLEELALWIIQGQKANKESGRISKL